MESLSPQENYALEKTYSPAHVLSHRSLAVRMDITGVCNLRCRQCPLHDMRTNVKGRDSIMSLDMFQKIANEVFPYAHTVALSCEAEPTLHPEFDQILSIIKGIKTPTYYMTTHGNGISDERLERMIDSGLGCIAVSVDGMNPETYEAIRVRGKFDKVMHTITKLSEIKSSRKIPHNKGTILQMNFTLMKSTINQLEDAVRFCAEYGVMYLVAVHIHSLDFNHMHEESLQSDPDKSDMIIKQAYELASKLGVKLNYPAPFHNLVGISNKTVKSDFTNYSKPSCLAPWSMLRIRYNGDLSPCDLWNMAEPIGSFKNNSFNEIWNGEKYRKLREGHLTKNHPFKYCIGCTATTPDNLEKKDHKNSISFKHV